MGKSDEKEWNDESEEEHKENGFYFEKEYDLILCIRFLERSLLQHLWKMGKMMKQNGYLMMVQFMEGCEKWGHPKNKNRMLKAGELKQVFGDQEKFRIVVDGVIKSEDGRPMQAFLCQKL